MINQLLALSDFGFVEHANGHASKAYDEKLSCCRAVCIISEAVAGSVRSTDHVFNVACCNGPSAAVEGCHLPLSVLTTFINFITFQKVML